MKAAWFNIGLDIVHMDTCGSITAIIKPVRNQVTGEIQRWHQEDYRSPYKRMGKPPDHNNKSA
ncbi:hypothetical protein [Paenibacillus jilunlii]|uniref:Uncharacterized protein n=1 Tax=Paenibacillus jilunlii TaxID=682956 RepID=A0A1G9ZZ46_9BACL|nr:hypothetical protein [Paenibacillus jilunlii]KWX79932.1 hypothetical protein AML91_01825 [Paenibacillus jilunlii]SDN26892.1 hypothetical protein SAMN05216191_13419 [Paenibacillus jilunlii]